MSVDAIVLPANEKLKEGSGTSKAIFEKVNGPHFVGHYGKIVCNRMGVFHYAQIQQRSKIRNDS